MLIIPNVEINGQEFEFTYVFDNAHPNNLYVTAWVKDGKTFTFEIDNFHLLTKCAIIELCHKKVEECLK